MSIIPVIGVRVMLRILQRAGFFIVRQVGSHLLLHNPITNRSVSVAMHAGDLSRKMTAMILKQAGVSVETFLKLLGK